MCQDSPVHSSPHPMVMVPPAPPCGFGLGWVLLGGLWIGSMELIDIMRIVT